MIGIDFFHRARKRLGEQCVGVVPRTIRIALHRLARVQHGVRPVRNGVVKDGVSHYAPSCVHENALRLVVVGHIAKERARAKFFNVVDVSSIVRNVVA